MSFVFNTVHIYNIYTCLNVYIWPVSSVSIDCYGHCRVIVLCHNNAKAITIVNDSVLQPINIG